MALFNTPTPEVVVPPASPPSARADDGTAPGGLIAFINSASPAPRDTFTPIGTIRRD
jgi:hypothetical protein